MTAPTAETPGEPQHGIWESVYIGTGPYVGGRDHTICKLCYEDKPNHKPDCAFAASELRLAGAVGLLNKAWWSRDLHGCRFCFDRSGQASTANMVRHTEDCPYAKLAALAPPKDALTSPDATWEQLGGGITEVEPSEEEA